MIPHKVDSKTGNTIQGARGSSMGLILRMLGEMNSNFAHGQYDLFKANFISETVGLPSIREYPQGQTGSGDVDSGPVVFGVGFSATIVSIGTLSIYNDSNLADQQYQTIHAFGFERKQENNKQYLFGQLPMADAFIAWGRATGLSNTNDSSEENTQNWRWKFHLITTLILLMFWTFYFRKALVSKILQKR